MIGVARIYIRRWPRVTFPNTGSGKGAYFGRMDNRSEYVPRELRRASPQLLRFMYFCIYGLLPGWLLTKVLPAPISDIAAVAIVCAAGYMAVRISVSETPDGVRVRNFWKAYDIHRTDVVEVTRNIWARSIWMLAPNSDCLEIQLRDS